MNQNLSLYRIFYTVARSGNISRAADELFISQPAVSKAVRKLEQSVGCALFTRSSRGVQLTEDGELLYSHVKSALQTLESAENQLRLRHELGMGQLRIGVSSTLCKYVLLPSLKDFVKLHPHLRVTITCQSTSHTLRIRTVRTETFDDDMRFAVTVYAPAPEAIVCNGVSDAQLGDIRTKSPLRITLNGPGDIEAGRIEADGRTIASFTVVGHKRICRFAPVRARALTIRITAARAEPALRLIAAYR